MRIPCLFDVIEVNLKYIPGAVPAIKQRIESLLCNGKFNEELTYYVGLENVKNYK